MTRSPYSSDLTDAEWQLIEPLIPPAKPGEDLLNVNMREIVNAMFYLSHTGCPWEKLPDDLPSYSIVYLHFRRWQQDGVWKQMKARLRKPAHVTAARQREANTAFINKPKASTGIINNQSVKTTESLNVKVLEQSFERVKSHTSDFASSFYRNLLTDCPQLRPLFANTTMQDQEKKLMMSLMLVINNLRNLAYLNTLLKDLGKRHVKYGAMREHYPLVGAALLKTFERFLGKDWTPEVKQAWTDAYGAIANLMLEGEDLHQ